MKRIYILIFFVLSASSITRSQNFDWVNSNPVAWSLNPEMPRHTSCVSSNGNIYAARMETFTQYFGSIFGTSSIDCYNSSGQLIWNFPFGPKSVIQQIVADSNGNLLVGGIYLETLMLNGTDSLTNNNPPLTTQVFLFSLDASGSLLWKRNLSLTNSNIAGIEALSADAFNNFWYAGSDFLNMSVTRIDNNGQDIQTIVIGNARTIGGICFDANNNIFVSGSVEMGTMTIGNFNAAVPESYMMFVAYLTSTGQASWVKLAHDVTFQSPVCVSDGAGGAYIAGSLMDSTSFGSVSFQGPDWVYDVFLTHVDASGNFNWGVEVPHSPTLTGDFSRGANNFISTDNIGNVYMCGITRGTVDWGNGMISGSTSVPSPSRQLSIIGFSSNGTPINHLDGGQSDFDQAYSINFLPNGEGYFSGAVIDTAYFGSNIINQGGGLAYMIGKINTGLSSVNNLTAENKFLLYPVPANDKIFVQINPLMKSGDINLDISIYNMQGQLLATEKCLLIENERLAVDISYLPAGCYFMNINSLNGISNLRFTIMR